MRKILNFIIGILIILSLFVQLSGCGNKETTEKIEEDSKECDHEWLDATCFLPKTCNKCGNTIGEALGHSTDRGTCSRCGTKLGWFVGNYVDEFKQPTGEYFIYTDAYGTYTTNYSREGNLYVEVMVGRDAYYHDIQMWLDLYEDGYMRDYDYSFDYELTILDSNGAKHYCDEGITLSSDGFTIKGKTLKKVLELLDSNETLSLYFNENYKNSFLFTIYCGNFKSLYNEMF